MGVLLRLYAFIGGCEGRAGCEVVELACARYPHITVLMWAIVYIRIT